MTLISCSCADVIVSTFHIKDILIEGLAHEEVVAHIHLTDISNLHLSFDAIDRFDSDIVTNSDMTVFSELFRDDDAIAGKPDRCLHIGFG